MYQQQKDTERQVKVGDETDELNERTEGEASAARRVLAIFTRSINPVSRPSYSSNFNASLPPRNGWKNLERIRIPAFSGNKTEFQHWNVTVTSCVDATAMSAQFKMLRLEACLVREALETIKGEGYSEAAYDTAK